MRKILFLTALILINTALKAQTARSYALELRSHYNDATGDLTIYWQKDLAALGYDVARKLKNQYTWSSLFSLSNQDSFFVLPNYQVGEVHDVWVKKRKSPNNANGFMHVGYHLPSPLITNPNILLLLIDTNFVQPVANEIARYISDLENENWEVHTHIVQRSDSVQKVKRWIVDKWRADSGRVKSVVLLGRVPVPYSGNITPDVHNDHRGAWPADVYYVTFDLNWTDVTVNNSAAARPENRNVPGDNKFDQDYIWPALAKIPLGRIDLTNMPAFGNDTFLMKRYLDKNHAFRSGQLRVNRRGLIDDNFGVFGGEAFAASGWRDFNTMFGDDVYALDYFSSMRDSSFLFSFGCGNGTYTSASGIGSSSNFVSDSLLNPFTSLFGSYFGDWDNANNFLRAPLASKGWGLVSGWGGRPHWFYHHAALNEPVGFGVVQAQNSYPTYEGGGTAQTYVHIAMMGDPSLRLHVLPAVDSIGFEPMCQLPGMHRLSWNTGSSEADSVLVQFRMPGGTWQFQGFYAASNRGVNLNLPAGNYEFRIYSSAWIQNPSGYFNITSHPKNISVTVYPRAIAAIQSNTLSLCVGDTLRFNDNSTGAYLLPDWYLNGNLYSQSSDSVLIYPGAGNHVLSLIVRNQSGCTDSTAIAFTAQVNPELQRLALVKPDGLPSCAGLVNPFQLNGQTGASQTRLLVYWGDSSNVLDTALQGNFMLSKQFVNEGRYQGKVYLLNDNATCFSSDTFSATVNPNPQAILNSSANFLCMGDTLFYSQINPDPINSVAWFLNSQSMSSSTDSFLLHPGVGNYTLMLRLENQFGCADSSIVNFTAYSSAELNRLTLSKPDGQPSCDGRPNAFLLSLETGAYPLNLTLNWGDGSALVERTILGNNDFSKTFNQTGTYQGTVFLTDSSGNCSAGDSFQVIVHPTPNKPNITPKFLNLESPSGEFRSEYQENTIYWWNASKGITLIDGDSAHKVTADVSGMASGLYFVSVIQENEFGCKSDSNSALLNYTLNYVVPLSGSWVIFPNPSSTKARINFSHPQRVLRWELMDIQGKKLPVFVQSIGEKEFEIVLDSLAPGAYILIAETSDKPYFGRLVKQ